MSGQQLADRLGITRQGLAELEQREREGTATLTALSRAAEALDCELVYAIVPRAELHTLIEEQARARAVEEIDRITHTMRLEDQESRPEEVERLIEERTADLMAHKLKRLWAFKASSKSSSVMRAALHR